MRSWMLLLIVGLPLGAYGGRAAYDDPTQALIENATFLPLRRVEKVCVTGYEHSFILGPVVVRSEADLVVHCEVVWPDVPPVVDFEREVGLYVGTKFTDGELYDEIVDAWQRPDETIVRLKGRRKPCIGDCRDSLALYSNVDFAIMPRPTTPIRFVTIPPTD